jgi:hypothetical protein
MRVRATLPLALAILAPAVALAGVVNSLEDVVRTVRDANRLQRSDNELAKALRKLNLNVKLDNRTAEELESEISGPRSTAELENLREITRDMPLPAVLPWFASPLPPKADELRAIFGEALRKALVYTANLPDFICTETVRRYESTIGRGGWALKDTLTLQLTYFEHQENYKLNAVNGRKTMLTYDEAGGAVSKGEFGTMLYSVFAPETKTEFRWSNWTTLRKRPAYVLSFRIEAANSHYHLMVGQYGWNQISTVPSEHGLVYIDRETKEVLRLECIADTLPDSFPLAGATRTLDYGSAEVGGRSFLLPLHFEMRMRPRSRYPQTRNEVDFTGYRKFAGESTISFGDAGDAQPGTIPPVKK